MAKSKKKPTRKAAAFNVNGAGAREAIGLQLAGERGASDGLIDAITKLVVMCQSKHMIPDDASDYCWALAEARAKRDSADLKVNVPVIEPSATNIAEFKGILKMHSLPFVGGLLADCKSIGISLASLKRVAAWCRDKKDGFGTSKTGPSRGELIDKVRELRGLKNAGRSGKRAKKRRNTGQGRKPDPVARLAKLNTLAKDWRKTFGDDNGMMTRIITNTKNLMAYAREVKKAQDK